MKIELKGFQIDAAQRLLRHVNHARKEVRDGDAQAIILSSPTGSGKTVTVTQLMEWIYQGGENIAPDPGAVFLWLSDSPELNDQSRDKIVRQASVFKDSSLVLIEPTFDQERFEAGKVYFLNTQKLGKDSLLTRPGDERTYTIWQTIQNTAEAKSDHLYIIIDEAHRGMTEKKKEREQAATIMQRFIKGYPDGGMEPLKLVIGMSATPERFSQLIEGTGSRIKREWIIKPDDVKDSGLLKDRIVLYYPGEDQPADWSLLEEAVKRWRRFGDEWSAYCTAQGMAAIIEPVLVIQVEDGSGDRLTNTDLGEVVKVVERVTGPLPDDAWAHAFQEDKTIEAAARRIRKIEASKIEYDRSVKIVLFKMSLTTGWDCPRAEVMMSFRRAKDHTLIAQLVGRMVRTPLARSIEGQDFLNTVSLYLPHYDKAGLQAILEKLNNPDPEIGIGIEVEAGNELTTFRKAAHTDELFARLATLPTYRVERTTKASNVQRLMKLARRLAYDEIDTAALDAAKLLIVKTLTGELTRLSKRKDFAGNIAANQEIELREVTVAYGEWKEIDSPGALRIKATQENIDDLFDWCKRQLGRDGLEMDFWRSRRSTGDPQRAKLELYGILNDEEAWAKLEKISGERLQALFKEHRGAIEALSSSKQEEYSRIKRAAKNPAPDTLRMPPTIEIRGEQPEWERHLYVDQRGRYGAHFNTWETPVLQEELAKKEVVGWLRNLPRKPWSLSIPYRMEGEDKPLYPDFIIFRRVRGKIVVDLIDPHSSDWPDAVFKARGLAEYAQKHGDHFGRIEMIAKNKKNELKRLNLNDEVVREKVKKVSSKEHLDLLFEEA